MPTVLLTGSTRGIGRAFAEAPQARGAGVIGHAARAMNADTIAADLSDPTGPQRVWQEALQRAGGQIDAWKDTLRISFIAATLLSRFALRRWLETGAEGRLVHIASRGGPALLAGIPLDRVAKPKEVARTAEFRTLDAPPSMTGAVSDANGVSYVR